MKLIYKGKRGHRRVNGRPLRPGDVIEEQHEGSIEYFLSLRLGDGSPEFVPEKNTDTTIAADEIAVDEEQ